MLLGRTSECGRIDALIARARAGASGVLVLRGEPGMGKTALLEHAAAGAGSGAVILRARGIESEVEVAFAGLHELLRPVLGAIDDLPDPQAHALRAALGLEPAAAAERHLVGAAVLGLLGTLAEEDPVLVLVDDVQWLDGPSSGALVFAARRLLADAVAVVIAVRAGEPSVVDGVELDEIAVAGLAPGPARQLLTAHAGRPVAVDTTDWLHAATGGNPLALVELAAEAPRLRPGPVDDHVAVSARIEGALGRRLDRLPPAAGAALLATAVADADDIDAVLAAAATLGGSLAGLEAAEAAELVSVEAGRVSFRHPLIRSAVLHRADPAARRAAHRAYADALDPATAGDRRAWHAAAGTVAPEEPIAAALAAVGARAGERGGHATAAAALEQAARLTPDPDTRGERLRGAAEAAWLAGDGPHALDLLDGVTAGPSRAGAAHLRGKVLARRGPIPLAIRVLLDAAEEVADRAPGQASEMLADAAYAAVYGNAGPEMDRIARRAVELAPAEDARARCLAATALGAALVLRGDPEAARWLTAAAALIDATPALRDDVQIAAWLGVPAAFMRGEPAEYDQVRRAVALARERGAVGVLPFALFHVAVGAAGHSRWAEAVAAFSEGRRLAAEAGLPVDEVAALAGLARLEALRGDTAAGPADAEEALRRSRDSGMPFFEAWALQAQGDLAWARDDLEAAVSAFEEKAAVLAGHGYGDPDLSPAPELVELLVRLGRDGEATALAERATAAAEAKGQAWALARARRAEGIVAADDAVALERFAAAVALHEQTADAFELARTRACLGERLRRAGRRSDARPQLRAALATFDALGATPSAERASAELRATGETVRRRDASTVDELTPQELRIALMLAEGATTRQAASALYLSPKTVEYHLRHVYLKLGVNSRDALAAAMNAGARAAPASAPRG